MSDQDLINFVAEAMRPDAFDPLNGHDMDPMEIEAWQDNTRCLAKRAIKAYEQWNETGRTLGYSSSSLPFKPRLDPNSVTGFKVYTPSQDPATMAPLVFVKKDRL